MKETYPGHREGNYNDFFFTKRIKYPTVGIVVVITMDNELLIALMVFWLSSTTAIVVFLIMWWFNEGEAFHPHSIDIDHRHKHFVVVGSSTECKTDCAVQSISAFVAPRGSSSSKQFY
jgi:hypothetical protein